MRQLMFALPLILLCGSLWAAAPVVSVPQKEQEQEQAQDIAPEPRLRWSAGAGMEGRVQQEVNPDITESTGHSQLFTQLRFRAFGLALEGGVQQRSSSSGALKVKTRSLNLGLWGRYEFREPLHWSPFVALGAGSYFDTVTSSFMSEMDQRTGRRDFFGLGGGVSTALWEHLLMEAEMRATLIQDRKDIAYSGIVRFGFVL